jgi:sucrose-6-phosphate hydrolase SacC (GH32 family)
LYLPVGARGPKNAGGGIHWFKASDEAMTHVEEMGFLFTVNVAPNGSSVGPLMECPDVFLLDGKAVVLGSLPGVPVNTEGTSHWWVGNISDDDMSFSPESTGRFDWGPGGFSSIYAAKSGTQAKEPFTRRVLFGFGGWREGMALDSECGASGFYVLPRELSISSQTGKLQQRPVVELHGLRQGDAIHGPDNIAAGAQVEVLVQCRLPAGAILPSTGVIAVSTLQTTNRNQTVQVGFNFSTKCGFAMVPPSLGLFGNTSRVDVTPQLDLFNVATAVAEGGTEARTTNDLSIELNVFVDGARVETFYGSETTITTSVRNTVPGSQLSSSFVNTVEVSQLQCNVTSWSLALPATE